MVRGIDGFREWFRGYEEQYTIIGGTACDLLMTDACLQIPTARRSGSDYQNLLPGHH